MLSQNFNYDINKLSISTNYQFVVDSSQPVNEDILLCFDEEVLCFLRAIDVTKAFGPDGFSGHMLKGTAESIAPTLTYLHVQLTTKIW